MIAVRPSLCVVAYDVLADARPLPVILRREYARAGVAVDDVLNGHAQPVDRLHARLVQRLEQPVGVREEIARRIVLVRIEIRKHIGDVDEAAAAERAAHVVQTGIRYVRFGQEMKQIVIGRAPDRRLTHAVDLLDRADRLIEVHCHCRHGSVLPAICLFIHPSITRVLHAAYIITAAALNFKPAF